MKTFAASLFLLIASIGVSSMALGIDVVNGYSGQTTISSVVSNYTVTLIKLTGVASGCGHPDYWVLPLDASEASRYKRAALTGAFLSGKSVNLRCESSIVSDFQIFS